MKQTPLASAISLVIAAITADAKPTPARKNKSILALSTTDNGEAELLIYGYIGDWFDGITAEGVVSQLNGTSAETINVYIASDGGVVNDGLAIYSALRRHKARKIVYIDGIAASIASVIAMAGDEILMPPHTGMMLHAARGPAFGTAQDHEDFARDLRANNGLILEAYVSKAPGKRAELEAICNGTQDHWFSASEAVEFGLADRVLEEEAREPTDAAAAAAMLSYINAVASAPTALASSLRKQIQSTARPTVFVSLSESTQRAVVAQIEDPIMRKNLEQIVAAVAAAGAPAGATAPASAQNGATQDPPPPVTATASQPASPAATTASQPAAANTAQTAAPAPATSASDPITAVAERNTQLRGIFAAYRHIEGIGAIEADCLADPRMTVQAAQQRLLDRIGAHGQPLNGGFRVEAGEQDESRTQRARIVAAMLARAGVLTGAEAEAARQDNPHARMTMLQIAEGSLIRAGVNTRSLDRTELASRALAVQTTADFPILLENTLHRMLIAGYQRQAFTWNRFCATGTLSDYRPHNRYQLSSFSDLKEVNEAGEYENGVIGDARKESITGKRKGRILQVTPEVLVNDDLGMLSNIAGALGQAAGRTIEKDVYALFALNSGAGPIMADGKALFHADHGNIAASGSAPSVEAFDAIRQQLASQKDPGDNDYLDIEAAIWLGPLSLGGKAREVNGAEYNDEATKNQRRPNVVRGMFRDIVDSPRLPATVWYAFADPNIAPVIEVAFLDGIQQPRIEQETNFRTDGLAWKATHRYGVGAVGFQGAIKQPGT